MHIASASPRRWPRLRWWPRRMRGSGRSCLDVPGRERISPGRPQDRGSPAAHGDLRAEIARYLARGIDGFFTDFPAIGVAARDAWPAAGHISAVQPSTSRTPPRAFPRTACTAGSCCRACPAVAGSCRSSSPRRIADTSWRRSGSCSRHSRALRPAGRGRRLSRPRRRVRRAHRWRRRPHRAPAPLEDLDARCAPVRFSTCA